MLTTFVLACIAWVFFRAASFLEAVAYFKTMLVQPSFDVQYLGIQRYATEMLFILAIFIALEWAHRTQEHPFVGRWKWFKIAAVILMLLTLGVYSDHQDFIYFQF
jgi:uncharacterized membrane protein